MLFPWKGGGLHKSLRTHILSSSRLGCWSICRPELYAAKSMYDACVRHNTITASRSPAKLALPYQQWEQFLRIRCKLHTTTKLTNVTAPLFVNGANRALSLVAEWYRLHPTVKLSGEACLKGRMKCFESVSSTDQGSNLRRINDV